MLGTDATFPLCVATSSKLPADPSPKRSKNRGHWPSTVLTTSCPRVLPLLSSIPTFSLMPHRALFLNSGARVPPTHHHFSSRLSSHCYKSPSARSALRRIVHISALGVSKSNPLHSHSSKFFVAPKKLNPFVIKQIQTPTPTSQGGVSLSHRGPPQQASLLALCFHGLTNCFSRNPFVLIIICVAPRCGGPPPQNCSCGVESCSCPRSSAPTIRRTFPRSTNSTRPASLPASPTPKPLCGTFSLSAPRTA